MSSWPQIAVVGPGAVGSFFGAMLARAGAPTRFIGRPGSVSSHLEAIRRGGLRIDGTEIDETVAIEVAAGPEAVADAGLVLFAVKTLDNETAAAAIRPHLRPGTPVVSLQNGMENVDRLAAAGVAAIPAVVYVAAAIETPGAIRHRGRGDLIVGAASASVGGAAGRAAVEQIAAWFEAAGVPCPVSADIRRDQWEKLVINSMANAISALTGASYRRLVEYEPTWRLARAVAREAGAVAAAEGIAIDVDRVIAAGETVARSVGEATSSTQHDLARGRRTEIESLNGYISRRGVELGVATPANDALYALVALREQRG